MISPVTLGSMEFGSKVDESKAARLFGRAMDAGVNAVDTANVYGSGRSEEIVGHLINGMRDKLILATKFSVPTDSQDPNSGGTSPPHRHRSVRGKLAPTPDRLHRSLLHPPAVDADRDR
jgi:aryl-alcohol dehydrogenase-like predicted oxidoreductase